MKRISNYIKGKSKLKEIWKGDWNKGFKSNFDIFIWPDGRKYEGYWKEDKEHEEGHYYTSKRKMRRGQRENRKKENSF